LRRRRGASISSAAIATMAAGTAYGVIEKVEKGAQGGSSSASIRALRTRFVEVPMSVHIPPSIERKERGISRMWAERRWRALQPSTTGMSIATTDHRREGDEGYQGLSRVIGGAMLAECFDQHE